MPPNVELDCNLDPPLTNWNSRITCRTMPMLISGLEALAEAICDNPPSEFDEFIELVDTPNSYIGESGKLVAVNNTEDGLEFVDNVATDELVKVSVNDTTPDYLLAKLAQGNGITLTETNDGGDEDVTITVNQSQLALASLGTKSHTSLTDIGTNTHPQIDTAITASTSHIANTSNPHSTTFLKLGDVPSTYVAQSLKYPRVNVGETALEFITPATLAGTLSHTNLTNIGTNTHAQIDTHIASTSNPHSTTLEQARTAGSAMTGAVTNTVATATTVALKLKSSDDSSTNRLFQTLTSGDVESFAVGGKGSVFITPLATTGTPSPALTLTGSAHTALTAATEYTDVNFNLARSVQFTTGGAISSQRSMRIQGATYTATSATQTITTAITLEINPPVQGTNVSIGTNLALRVTGVTQLNDVVVASGTLTLAAGVNIAPNITTGTKIGTSITQKLSFWNATPVVQNTGWTITNDTPDKVLDCNATSLDELADIIGTVINTLKTYGILGA